MAIIGVKHVKSYTYMYMIHQVVYRDHAKYFKLTYKNMAIFMHRKAYAELLDIEGSFSIFCFVGRRYLGAPVICWRVCPQASLGYFGEHSTMIFLKFCLELTKGEQLSGWLDGTFKTPDQNGKEWSVG